MDFLLQLLLVLSFVPLFVVLKRFILNVISFSKLNIIALRSTSTATTPVASVETFGAACVRVRASRGSEGTIIRVKIGTVTIGITLKPGMMGIRVHVTVTRTTCCGLYLVRLTCLLRGRLLGLLLLLRLETRALGRASVLRIRVVTATVETISASLMVEATSALTCHASLAVLLHVHT